MSAFINELREQLGDLLRPVRSHVSTIPELKSSVQICPDPLRMQRQTVFSVTWQFSSWQSDTSPLPKEALFNNALGLLTHAVYGDFKENLLRLRQALYEQDTTQALLITNALFKEIGER